MQNDKSNQNPIVCQTEADNALSDAADAEQASLEDNVGNALPNFKRRKFLG